MENVKKGTTTVGLVCKDGLVLAADKRATSGSMIVNRDVDKVYKITDNMIVTMAGTVSDAQLLTKLIKAELALKRIRTDREPTVTESANLLAGMIYSNIRKMSMIPGISHFVLGGKDSTGFYLYDLYADGSLTQCKDFISSGSGSVMAYGVLDTLYKPTMTVGEGVKLCIKCINAALKRDSATGDGIDIYTITNEGIVKAYHKQLEPDLN
ncbi:MAG: proteasome subunit beta [Nanoarchaeota archaeon]|nr:proteasome subunit beta [Nanoarchaeota archaeon]